MAARYASYLVRSWRTPDGARRVVVEHVQSGARAAVPTLDAMVECIAAWEATPPEPAGQRPGSGDEQDIAAEEPARQT